MKSKLLLIMLLVVGVLLSSALAVSARQTSSVPPGRAAGSGPVGSVKGAPNWNPPGAIGGYNNHPIGVYYTGTQWAIFNQDLAPMSVGLGFNVMVVKQ